MAPGSNRRPEFSEGPIPPARRGRDRLRLRPGAHRSQPARDRTAGHRGCPV